MDLRCKHECLLSPQDILLVLSDEKVKDMKHQKYEGDYFQVLKLYQLDLKLDFFDFLLNNYDQPIHKIAFLGLKF